VLGRADDVIVTGGTNVAPQPVEAVISELDAVRECLVVGVPDDRWGERVVALLVVSAAIDPAPEGGAPGLDAVRHLVKGRLGAAAAPRDVLAVDTLPATALGKPDRRAAARLAEELLSRAPSGDRV
jgi:O-succinylbenzoic acid--CoA ligase